MRLGDPRHVLFLDLKPEQSSKSCSKSSSRRRRNVQKEIDSEVELIEKEKERPRPLQFYLRGHEMNIIRIRGSDFLRVIPNELCRLNQAQRKDKYDVGRRYGQQ